MNYPDNNYHKILVAMSGGVDSSAAALILKRKGFDVKGAILRIHDENMTSEDLANGKLPQSIWYAREVARRIRLDFNIVDVRESFRQDVITYFVSGSDACRYPDPCVYCCAQFLFPQLLQVADQLGCTYVASGHYAITGFDEKRQRYVVRKGRDAEMDESNVLYSLSQEQLKRLITPLGIYDKEEVRNMAQEARLKNARTPDSPKICFIRDGCYREFLEGQVSPEALEIVGDPLERDIVPGTRIRAGNLYYSGIEKLPEEGMKVRARIRRSFNECDGFAHILEDGTLEVELQHPLKAAVPGQCIVLYDGDVVAMGGIIKEMPF